VRRKSVNICKGLEGKPLFSPLYGVYTVTLNELKADLKVSAQERQSGVITKLQWSQRPRTVTSRKRRDPRGISLIILRRQPKKSSKQVPTFAADKLPPRAVLTRKFFAPFRTTDMNTEISEEMNTLPEQEAPRKLGRSPSILILTNLIRLQSDIKKHVK
jgi:hypothetical protein